MSCDSQDVLAFIPVAEAINFKSAYKNFMQLCENKELLVCLWKTRIVPFWVFEQIKYIASVVVVNLEIS